MAVSTMTPLVPRQPVPSLAVETVGGDRWHLDAQRPENFTLVVFYRGLHCPICASYLRDLSSKLAGFTERGVEVVAISTDTVDRARTAKEKWHLDGLTVGYGLDLETAQRWGLYISRGHGPTSAGVEEPSLFSEPALYLVRPDGTLYFGAVQTMPFARPHFDDILKALDFVITKNYPARGEVVEPDEVVSAAA